MSTDDKRTSRGSLLDTDIAIAGAFAVSHDVQSCQMAAGWTAHEPAGPWLFRPQRERIREDKAVADRGWKSLIVWARKHCSCDDDKLVLTRLSAQLDGDSQNFPGCGGLISG